MYNLLSTRTPSFQLELPTPRPLGTGGARRLPNHHQYHHKSTEISHYNDCVTKHMYGRSIKSEFGAYGQARLEKQAMEVRGGEGRGLIRSFIFST